MGEILEIRTEARIIQLCDSCVRKGYQNLLALQERQKDENKLLKSFKKYLVKKKLIAIS